jgi:putrescine transport system permease protein
VIWQEFFVNRDWPVAAALAVVTLVILLIPIILFNMYQEQNQRKYQEVNDLG